MPKFRNAQQFVVTRGAKDVRIGTACSIERAEGIGESLRKGTEYTIWKWMDGAWRCYRNRRAGLAKGEF